VDSNDKEKLRRKNELGKKFKSKTQEEQLKILYCVLLKQIELLYRKYKNRISEKDFQKFWYYYLTFALVASERVANRGALNKKETSKFDQAIYHAFKSNLIFFLSLNLTLSVILIQ